MSDPLFLVDELPAVGHFRLAGVEGHHAADVQRLRVGESLLLADGRGGVASAVVTAAGRGTLDLTVTERREVTEQNPRLVAVQGIAKGDRGELAVAALTEVGVDEIVPWSAVRCVVQWRGERGARSLGRWRATAREAAKQSRRARVPAVAEPMSTAALADRVSDRLGHRLGHRAGHRVADGVTGRVLVLHEGAAGRLTEVALPPAGEITIVVGPEGGIAPEELERLVGCGATPVRLGRTVLRTSTAGVAALSVLSARLGRW